MVRGGKSRAGHRGGDGHSGQGIRGSRDDPWDPLNPEDDPLRDLRVSDDEGKDPASDEYVWPQFDEEDDD
ncbi:MAG: hypothetical protein M0Q92_12130 [Methanoregula sp.]|jgi:hypothetical protein|nr:hypothetical protein [Methanoregula sp.]